MFVIVPDILAEKIYNKIDVFVAKYPEQEENREAMYHDLVSVYNNYGVIADLEPKDNQ